MNTSWQSGIAYEKFMGRWSHLVAQQFLGWLAIPPNRLWLDVGCGTGTLAKIIAADYQPEKVIALDSSPDFITYARRSLPHPAVQFKVGNAETLELPAHTVDAVVSGLVLNFVPQPEAALKEIVRVTKPGGTIGIFVWDYADGMQMLRYFWDAAAALNNDAKALDEGAIFPLCKEGQLEALFHKAGLNEVEASPIEVAAVFESFDDYWQPFLGSVGPAGSYTMSLNGQDRTQLKARLRESLPIDETGAISLLGRAWAVKVKVMFK
jgi:SAM-dependent methyltransferase